MAENIFDRLARKIELSKKRQEQAAKDAARALRPGLTVDAQGKMTYAAPAPAPAAAPAPAPAASPATSSLTWRSGAWYYSGIDKPPRLGQWRTVAFNPVSDPNAIQVARDRRWDGNQWRSYKDDSPMNVHLWWQMT